MQVFEACSACPAGLYQPERRATICLGCAPGNYSTVGSPECIQCPLGTFSDAANASACTPCDYGSYQDEEGRTACKACRPEMSTNGVGSTLPSDCVPTVFQIWAAGNNLWGQLGSGLVSNSTSEIWAAGNNLWGQLGSGFVSNSTSEVNAVPIQVANDVGNPIRGLDNEDVEAVAGGHSHTLFVTTGVNVAEGGAVSPRVWVAGQNVYGQLGVYPSSEHACNFPDAPDLVCTLDPKPNA
ncbi:hypothetical protein T484DRAFT_1796205, partial [Baffinella frigidus]